MVVTPITLELTSLGLAWPLTKPRHRSRNAGRLIKVTRRDGDTLTGRVTESDDSSATLDVDGTGHRVGFDDIAKAKVQIEFNRPAKPDDRNDTLDHRKE